MENDNKRSKLNDNKRCKLMFEKYNWRIDNFSTLDCESYSDNFIIDDLTWFIVICPPHGIEDYLEIYLEVDPGCANLTEGRKKTENFNLALIDQVNDERTIRKGFEYEFSVHNSFEGNKFLSFDELKNPENGFIVNDTCVIEAGIFVTKYVYENEEYEPICKIDENPVKDNDNPLFDEMFRRSFKNVDPTFVPLLEEVCLQHPALVESQENRGCMFTEWAFTALGRVLHFLITKKLEDMDDEACDHLQSLWDEVKIFEFDLDWLECDVAFALGVKEKAAKVKKLKEDVDGLEIKIEILKTEVERARKELVQAKEEFEEHTQDHKLGYGGSTSTFIN